MSRRGSDRFTAQTGVVGAVELPPFSAQYGRAASRRAIDARILELLSARLCHELSGPVAAINNGVELLAEEDFSVGSSPNPAFLKDAMALVSDSARRARSRLQFYRFAYGFSSGSAIAGPAPDEIAIGFFAATRIVGEYADAIRLLSPEWQKLACNLLLVGADALPRGGRLILTDAPLTLDAIGEPAALPPEAHEALILAAPIGELTPRTVQPYFTGLLAMALDGALIVTIEPGIVRFRVIRSSDDPS
jgi:histidine phosphotransferase ChpT